MGWLLPLAAGFAESASQTMQNEREQMWAEEQNMIQTMLPIAMTERKERRIQRKKLNEDFNRLKQYMTNDSAFSVLSQGTEFTNNFLEDIRKKEAEFGKAFRDENDLREAGMLQFGTTADLAGVRSTYKQSGRTFDDFMNEYVGKPTADPSINQNQIAEDLVRHFGKIPGFENTVKNSAYRKIAARMGISPEDVTSYISGEYSIDKNDRVTADSPIARRPIDREYQMAMSLKEINIKNAEILSIIEPQIKKAQLNKILAETEKLKGEDLQLSNNQLTLQRGIFATRKVHAQSVAKHIGGQVQVKGNDATDFIFDTQGITISSTAKNEDPVVRYVKGTANYRRLHTILDGATNLATKLSNEAIITEGKNASLNLIVQAGHSTTPGGQAYLLATSAANLDAKKGGNNHIELLKELLPNIETDLSNYNPLTYVDGDPSVRQTIKDIVTTSENTHLATLSDSQREDLAVSAIQRQNYEKQVEKIIKQILPETEATEGKKPLSVEAMVYMINSDDKDVLIKDIVGPIAKETARTGRLSDKKIQQRFNIAEQAISSNLKQYENLSEDDLRKNENAIRNDIMQPLNALLDPIRIKTVVPRREGSKTPTLESNIPKTLVETLSGKTDAVPLSIVESDRTNRATPENVARQMKKWKELAIKDLPKGHPRKKATSYLMSEDRLEQLEEIYTKEWLQN